MAEIQALQDALPCKVASTVAWRRVGSNLATQKFTDSLKGRSECHMSPTGVEEAPVRKHGLVDFLLSFQIR